MGVLIVDDDGDFRDELKLALESHGYPTSCASNGREALTKLRASDGLPCVVLLDILMPVMNGWDVLELIARDPALQDVPVVVMSGHVRSRHERDRASHAPGGILLEKPFSLEKLLSVIAQFCSPGPTSA